MLISLFAILNSNKYIGFIEKYFSAFKTRQNIFLECARVWKKTARAVKIKPRARLVTTEISVIFFKSQLFGVFFFFVPTWSKLLGFVLRLKHVEHTSFWSSRNVDIRERNRLGCNCFSFWSNVIFILALLSSFFDSWGKYQKSTKSQLFASFLGAFFA